MNIEDIRAKPTLRVEEAARIMDCSRSSMYELVHRGVIPALRLSGRTIRIPTARFLALLEGPEIANAPAAQTEALTDTDAPSLATNERTALHASRTRSGKSGSCAARSS